MNRFMRVCVVVAVSFILQLPVRGAPQDRTPTDVRQKADQIFAKWTASTPGCAVGASVNGTPTLLAGYGMADLEHDIKITPDTIFEIGSVSKQFTAAAVLLLARDGKVSIDDSVRKYIPELLDYGPPLTIRQMLNHTSGLRDWGEVAAIAGKPRWTTIYTQADALEIARRQRSLNFVPGTHWSYTNTGYNLAAIIVDRVSGATLDDFTQKRIFEPLAMTHSSWDSDHTRIVRGRAMAYRQRSDGFHTFTPNEDVYGNRGLLTTVGDLLKWNDNFASPKIGDAAFVAEQQEPGRFNDGRQHTYAFGLRIATRNGFREVSHNGSTAGYVASLVRYPDQRVSVAVLCNVTTADPDAYSRAVADLYLPGPLKADASAVTSQKLTERELDAVVGLYRSELTGVAMTIVRNQDALRLEMPRLTIPLTAVTEARFESPFGSLATDGSGHATLIDRVDSVRYERVPSVSPTTEQLREYLGRYRSDEADATFDVVLGGTSLVMKRGPGVALKLSPTYADGFINEELGTVIFRRDAAGRVGTVSIVRDRVWDLRFVRQ